MANLTQSLGKSNHHIPFAISNSDEGLADFVEAASYIDVDLATRFENERILKPKFKSN